MNSKLLTLVLSFICALLCASVVQAQEPQRTSKSWFDQSIWDNPERDYKWYPPDPPPAAKKEEPKPAAKPKKVSDYPSTKAVAEELSRLKDLAVLKRTPEHVKTFLAFQQEVMDNSAEYADVMRRIVWTNPELDYQQRRPTNNSAIATYDKAQTATERQTVQKLAANYGLFFFFKSDCPYCHQLAPMLKNFSALYGMNVLPISMDGGTLPDFPQVKPNNGLAEQLDVRMVPALYLIGKDKTIQPISYGVIAQSDLVERIHVLTQTKPGQNF